MFFVFVPGNESESQLRAENCKSFETTSLTSALQVHYKCQDLKKRVPLPNKRRPCEILHIDTSSNIYQAFIRFLKKMRSIKLNKRQITNGMQTSESELTNV